MKTKQLVVPYQRMLKGHLHTVIYHQVYVHQFMRTKHLAVPYQKMLKGHLPRVIYHQVY